MSDSISKVGGIVREPIGSQYIRFHEEVQTRTQGTFNGVLAGTEITPLTKTVTCRGGNKLTIDVSMFWDLGSDNIGFIVTRDIGDGNGDVILPDAGDPTKVWEVIAAASWAGTPAGSNPQQTPFKIVDKDTFAGPAIYKVKLKSSVGGGKLNRAWGSAGQANYENGVTVITYLETGQ